MDDEGRVSVKRTVDKLNRGCSGRAGVGAADWRQRSGRKPDIRKLERERGTGQDWPRRTLVQGQGRKVREGNREGRNTKGEEDGDDDSGPVERRWSSSTVSGVVWW